MKIVLTIHHPLDADTGAAGTVLRLAAEYRRAGHAVSILSFDGLPGWWPDVVKALLFPVWIAWRLIACEQDVDVVDASSGDGWLLYGLSRRLRALRVTHSHGLPHAAYAARSHPASGMPGRLGIAQRLYRGCIEPWLDARSLRKADVALLLNGPDRAYAVRHLGVAADRAVVLPNGLPEHFFAPESRSAAPAGGSFVVVQVGAHISRKGVSTTCAAMVPLLRSHPDMELRLLGTGNAEAQVRAQYPADLQDRLQVVPAFHNEELPRLLAGGSLILMPSASEGFGLAALEGMACGLVPVTSDIPGPTEYVRHGRNGLTFPSGSAQGLGACIARLHADRVLLAVLREQAVATAETYRLRRVAAERLSLYEVYRRLTLVAPPLDEAGLPWKIAAIACCMAVAVLAWLPKELEEPLRTGLPGPVEHALAYAAAAAVLRLAWRNAPTIVMAAGFAAVAGVLEVGQVWIPGRNARFIDFVGSEVGAIAGLLSGRLWLRHVRTCSMTTLLQMRRLPYKPP